MKHEMLGERRKLRFDPHLAERIEAWDRELTIKEEAEKRRQDLDARLNPKVPKPDEVKPAGYKAQDEWIAYFNDRNEVMVSMPDIYMAGKSNNKKPIDSLRRDFHDRWNVTSTRIIYNNNLDARIIHNYGSNLVQPLEHMVVIPEYRPQLLESALNTQEGLRYLQALFGTNDDALGIKDALHRLSDYAAGKTNVWSAALSARPSERAAGFYYDLGGFHVLGIDGLNLVGCFCGVRYASDSER